MGAGPLEDLILQHGPALVTEIDRLARHHPGFGAALRSAAISPGALDATTVQRLSLWTTR